MNRGKLSARSVVPAMTRRVSIFIIALALGVGIVSAQAPPPETPPFFFVQMSDPQFGMFTKDKDFAQETLNFELAIATANRWKPAFVVITGDLVNKPGDPAQIDEYLRITRKLDRAIPLYAAAGNHDIENEPTPATVAAYSKRFGRDYFSFRSGTLAGIVLNSTLIHKPEKVGELYDQQLAWLRSELPRLRSSGAKHLVVFQHHPWFLTDAKEADEYFNIPIARRGLYLDLFRQNGVKYLFSGHHHRNGGARDGEIETVVTGPVGMPLGDAPMSGVRVVIVRDSGLTHRFYGLGELPNQIELKLP